MSTTRPHPGPAPLRAGWVPTPVSRAAEDGRPGAVVPEGFVFPGTEGIDPTQVFAGVGYQAPQRRTDPWAVAALVTGLLSFLPVVGVFAAAMGALALRRLSNSYNTGVSMGWTGIVLGTTTTVVWLWVWFLTSFDMVML